MFASDLIWKRIRNKSSEFIEILFFFQHMFVQICLNVLLIYLKLYIHLCYVLYPQSVLL